jgi:hypothetical protein
LQGIGKKYFNEYHVVVCPVKWNFFPPTEIFLGYPPKDKDGPWNTEFNPKKEGPLEESRPLEYSEMPRMKMGENPNFRIKNAVF